MRKKILSLMLSIALVLSVLSVTVFADTEGTAAEDGTYEAAVTISDLDGADEISFSSYDVSVMLTVSDGVITAVDSTSTASNAYSQTCFSKALSAMQEVLVGVAASAETIEAIDAAEVDGVSGATWSAKAIAAAAASAISDEDSEEDTDDADSDDDADNEDDSAETDTSDDEISSGTYTVPVDVDDSAQGQDFGAVVEDSAIATVNEDGSVIFTLSFQSITVMGTYIGWVSEFYGYYDDDTLITDYTATYKTVIDENGESQTALDTVTFTVPTKEDSYTISYYLSSNVMSFVRSKTLSVDWENAVEGISESESGTVYTGSATVDGYYYDIDVSLTVDDGVITAVTVTSDSDSGVNNGEHEGSLPYYNKAVSSLTSSLIGVSATLEALESVDAVSGATMTSNAIINAVISALGLDESNEVTDIELEAGSTYSVEITYKAAAHSLVSNPTATADDDSDAVTATLVVDLEGNVAIVIELYNSEDMYITSYNGLHLGGSFDGELALDDQSVIYTAENDELEGGSYVTELTIPLDGLYKEYYTSVSVYVPSMYNVDMDGDGEIDEGYFTVDPSTLTIDWDTLTKLSSDSSDDEEDEYDYSEDEALGFHTVSATYTGVGAFEGVDRLDYAVGRYFGYRVGVEELDDGTWNIIIYFGGSIGYNSAIGDITVYISGDMTEAVETVSCGDDLTYVINVDSLDETLYLSLYVGGAMDMTVTYAMTVNVDEYQGHSYTVTETAAASDTEDGYIIYTCSVCADTYKEVIAATGKEEVTEETETETETEASGSEAQTGDANALALWTALASLAAAGIAALVLKRRFN